MKLILVAAATAFLVSGGTAYAQMSKGSPAAAKQGSTDPMIKEKTYDQLHRKSASSVRTRGPTNARAQAGAVGGSSGGK